MAAAAFLAIGVSSVLAPDWASQNFPWKVGPFFAQTVGAWSIGVAGMCIFVAARFSATTVVAVLAFLWLFALGEAGVVVLFLGKLQTSLVMTWPYLVGLLALLANGVVTILDWRQRQVDVRGEPGTFHGWIRAAVVGFAVVVAIIAGGNILSPTDGQVAQGRFFPEPLTLFSIRAFAAFFAAFFAAVSLSSLTLLIVRTPAPFWFYTVAGELLIVPILAVSFLNIGRFDAS